MEKAKQDYHETYPVEAIMAESVFGEKYPQYKDQISDIINYWHPIKNAKDWWESVPTILSTKESFWWHYKWKEFDFEWDESIEDLLNRKEFHASRKTGSTRRKSKCPYLYRNPNALVWKGFNDIETLQPDMAKKWHPDKNEGISPDMITPWDNKHDIVWHMLYFDSNTNKEFDFEWTATAEFMSLNSKCPYLLQNSNALLCAGFNDLQTKRPDIAKLWNETKNEELKPDMVTPWCDKEVWWYFSYDDPESGKHWDFEWKMKISTMAHEGRKIVCPFLYKKNPWVWPGFNDVATNYPHILADWDYESNGDPSKYSKHSHQCISWICSKCGNKYYEEIYNKGKSIKNRCCCCSNQGTSFPEQAIFHYVKKYFKDAINRCRTYGFELDVYIPSLKTGIEYDGAYFHQDIYWDIQKNEKCQKKGINLIRVRETGCPEMNDKKITVINRKNVFKNDSLQDIICSILELLGVNIDLGEIDVDDFKNNYIEHQKNLLSA